MSLTKDNPGTGIAVTSNGSIRRRPIELNRDNVSDFLNGFDTIMTDCDGVVWYVGAKIEGAADGLMRLKSLNKKVYYVTNSSIMDEDTMMQMLQEQGHSVSSGDIVFPALALVDHLKSIGFKKKIYLLGMSQCRNVFEKSGFQVCQPPEYPIEETVKYLLKNVADDPEVGAVFVDVDFNMNLITMMKAAQILKRPDCLFYLGVPDRFLPLRSSIKLMGPAAFTTILEDASGRKATIIGKPTSMLVDCLKKKKHFDPKRTLFIGDSLEQDVGLARSQGFKTLVVLTGVTKAECFETCDPQLIPDYVIPSLADFVKILPANSSL